MALEVHLWGKRVGVMSWDGQRNLSAFRYDDEFLNSKLQISPVHLPLSPRIYSFPGLPFQTFKGLAGVFADSLPDRFGEALMNSYFRTKGYSFEDLSPLDRLAYIGKRGIGALEYIPAKDVDVKKGRIDLEELKSLADFGIQKSLKLHTHLEEDCSDGFQDILSIGTSAGGARAKAVIAWNEKTGEIRSGQLDHGKDFEHWIIKLDVGKDSLSLGQSFGYGRIEYTYYQLARDYGLEMSECRLMEDQGRGHFMTKRFDRVGGGSAGKRHLHTLNGLRHLDYENVLSHSYNQLFEMARFLRISYAEQVQLFKQMVFNVVMRNCDDHTKNFSFMMGVDGVWMVAPSYDVSYSYDPNNVWVNGNMSVNGKRNAIGVEDLVAEGKRQGIKNCEEMIEEARDIAIRWESYATKNHVPEYMIIGVQASLNNASRMLDTGFE